MFAIMSMGTVFGDNPYEVYAPKDKSGRSVGYTRPARKANEAHQGSTIVDVPKL